MKVISVNNVHEALPEGMRYLDLHGLQRDSRAGRVLISPEPVTTVYVRPTERVLFWPQRDANPYFHFMEGLWMLSGRNDVAWIKQFNSKMAEFSDFGEILHGAYGYRWRHLFGFDQLATIVRCLKKNPDDRRCVLQMWDVEHDLNVASKDIPCNTQIMFSIGITGELDMTVCNRSNDIIWGAYGANAVHMSMLQEVMAAWIGVPVGTYWQMSNNYHAYIDTFEKHSSVLVAQKEDPYGDPNGIRPYPMVNSDMQDWHADLEIFMDQGPVMGIKDKFFRKVAGPLWESWQAWKAKDMETAFRCAYQCEAGDWSLACYEWLERRS